MAAPLLLQLEGITAMRNPFTTCFNLSALMRDLPADGCLFVHGTSDTIRTIAGKSGCHVFMTDPHRAAGFRAQGGPPPTRTFYVVKKEVGA
jgi:hypothetical protein